MNVSDLVLKEDAINLLCGKLLGEGETRKVFQCNLMPNHVIKVESNVNSFHNIREFEIWSEVMNIPHMARWFARVHSMSHNGRFLIMEKTAPARDDEYPDRIPVFFDDIKRENFGLITIRNKKTNVKTNCLVAHDYANNNLYKLGLTKRMRKVDWDAE